jgi:hypothetical protein
MVRMTDAVPKARRLVTDLASTLHGLAPQVVMGWVLLVERPVSVAAAPQSQVRNCLAVAGRHP